MYGLMQTVAFDETINARLTVYAAATLIEPKCFYSKSAVPGTWCMAAETKPPHFALFVALTWLAIAAQLLAAGWVDTAHTLGDTDDALRLVQVRNFLAGQGWFDLHEARLGPPLGYDSHWSRLIDAGLAGLFVALHFFMNAQWAERLMRVVWPLLWLLPAIGAWVALAWRMRGRAAAQVLLLLLVVGLPAFSKFYPGRIDHHNVQIALALSALALAAWCDIKRWAGAASRCADRIGAGDRLESLPFLVVAGAVPALHYVFRPDICAKAARFRACARRSRLRGVPGQRCAASNWNRTSAIRWP